MATPAVDAGIGVAPDLSMMLLESCQAQVSVRAATDDGHAGEQLELTLLGVRLRVPVA
jgi:hypothetical protein